MVLKVKNVVYSLPCCDDGTEILEEVLRREKEAGIRPDHDVDTYMKVRIFSFIQVFNFHSIPHGFY